MSTWNRKRFACCNFQNMNLVFDYDIPHIRTLWWFTLPLKWKVVSSLKTKREATFSSFIASSIELLKLSRFNLSLGFKACNNYNLYSFIIKRHLKTCQTVVWGISSSWLAWLVDLHGLRWKLFLILSTLSSDTQGRPLVFRLHKHPVPENCLYHGRMLWAIGASIP